MVLVKYNAARKQRICIEAQDMQQAQAHLASRADEEQAWQ
jgi:hypothetical protein